MPQHQMRGNGDSWRAGQARRRLGMAPSPLALVHAGPLETMLSDGGVSEGRAHAVRCWLLALQFSLLLWAVVTAGAFRLLF